MKKTLLTLLILTSNVFAQDKEFVLSALEQTNIISIKELAKDGNSNAQYVLGTAYYDGKNIKKDEKEAIKWLNLSSKQGNSSAMYKLGMIYLKNKDYSNAIIKLNDSAKKNNSFAKEQIKKLNPETKNKTGQELFGAEKYAEAFEDFTISAIQNNTNSQFMLGIMYEEGLGVKENKKEAINWYVSASNLKNNDANLRLGALFISMDKYDEAKKWLSLADKNGNNEAKKILKSIK